MPKRTAKPSEIKLGEVERLKLLLLNQELVNKKLILKGEQNNFQKLVTIHNKALSEMHDGISEAERSWEKFQKEIEVKYKIPLKHYIFDTDRKSLVIRPPE